MITIKYNNWWDYKKTAQSVVNTLKQMDLYNKTSYAAQGHITEGALEHAAKAAHLSGNVYFVLISDDERPINALEINKGFYRVKFIDDKLRTYMSYDFTESSRKNLFLSSVTMRDYDLESSNPTKITDYIFKESGAMNVIERDLANNEQIDSEAEMKIDVSDNYEEYPEFGDYKSIIRKERHRLA